jgi:hypothetical protein
MDALFNNFFLYYVLNMGNFVSAEDNKFQEKGDYVSPEQVYSKPEVDSKFQAKGDYALKTDLSTLQPKGEYVLKPELSNFQPKGQYVWCADGVCNLPQSMNSVKIGAFSIENKDNKLCVVSPQDTFCYDGKIVKKL